MRYTLNRSNAGKVLLLSLTAVALYISYLVLRPFAGPILFASVVAIIFHPLHRYSQRFLHNRQTSALATTLLALLLATVPLVILIATITRELSDLYSSISSMTAHEGGVMPFVIHTVERVVNWTRERLSLPALDVRGMLTARIGAMSGSLLHYGAGFAGNLFNWIFKSVIAFFILFFLFRDGEKAIDKASALLPMTEERVRELRTRISSTVVANFYSGLAVGAIQGTLTALAFWALGLQGPILWGLVTAICSLIPMVGSAAVWAPASIFLLLSGHVVKGIILLAWGAGVVGLVDNFVRPLVISEAVRLHTLYVFFALLGGVQVFGVMGLFIGPVILSVTAALLSMVYEDFAAGEKARADSAAD